MANAEKTDPVPADDGDAAPGDATETLSMSPSGRARRPGRVELAAVVIGGDNEDWTELDLGRRLLEARHLELAGRLQEALATLRAVAEVAASQTFKALELEACAAACARAAESVKCFEQVRREPHGLGFALLVRRIDEI